MFSILGPLELSDSRKDIKRSKHLMNRVKISENISKVNQKWERCDNANVTHIFLDKVPNINQAK